MQALFCLNKSVRRNNMCHLVAKMRWYESSRRMPTSKRRRDGETKMYIICGVLGLLCVSYGERCICIYGLLAGRQAADRNLRCWRLSSSNSHVTDPFIKVTCKVSKLIQSIRTKLRRRKSCSGIADSLWSCQHVSPNKKIQALTLTPHNISWRIHFGRKMNQCSIDKEFICFRFRVKNLSE